MEGLQPIRELVPSTGFTSEPMTDEEREKIKAEYYNKSIGHLNDEDGYDCPICLNKGDIRTARQNSYGWWVPYHSPCKCMATRNTIKRMQRSGLKNVIKDCTFKKYIADEPWQQTIKAAAMEYAEDPKGWFYIGGQSGIGKSHLCTAICREFLLDGKEVKYMLWRDDVRRIKQAMEERESLMVKYKKVPVLYIDDLFKSGKNQEGEKQRPTVADINIAFEILNYRYADPDKLTIISSECTIDDILDIDEAVGGRIFERAKVFSVKPDRSKNYRLRGAVEI